MYTRIQVIVCKSHLEIVIGVDPTIKERFLEFFPLLDSNFEFWIYIYIYIYIPSPEFET